MPPRMQALPVLESGWPALWFAGTNPETGKVDLRLMDGRKLLRAIKEKRCWLCGEPLGRTLAFVTGPMCCVTRTSSEPPSHYDCAAYAVRACPFLARPRAHRSESNIPEGVTVAGIGIKRNPGVAVIWVTRSYRVWSDDNRGTLITVGDPLRVEWYAEGRRATRGEVAASIDSGAPALYETCVKDADAALSRKYLDADITAVQRLYPE